MPSDLSKIPEWVQLTPVGTFLHKPSGLEQLIDDTAIKSIVNRFRQESSSPNFPGLLLDFDHFSGDVTKPSEAAGWIKALQQREDGLWGKVDWSDSGKAAITGKLYKGISPVWNPKDCQKIDAGTIRPLRLDRAAVTNDPNIKGMRPLSNREITMTDEELFAPFDNAGTSDGARKGWLSRRKATRETATAKWQHAIKTDPANEHLHGAILEHEVYPWRMEGESADEHSARKGAAEDAHRQLNEQELKRQAIAARVKKAPKKPAKSDIPSPKPRSIAPPPTPTRTLKPKLNLPKPGALKAKAPKKAAPRLPAMTKATPKSDYSKTYDKVADAHAKVMHEQRGINTVAISDLHERSGIPLKKLQSHLVEGQRKGDYLMHPSTTNNITPEMDAAGIKLPGQTEKNITVTGPERNNGRGMRTVRH